VFPSSGEEKERSTTLLVPLERADFIHWTISRNPAFLNVIHQRQNRHNLRYFEIYKAQTILISAEYFSEGIIN
jgi:hypothetical protein